MLIKPITAAVCMFALGFDVMAQDNIGQNVTFRAKLTTELDSRKNQKGDKISAIVLSPEQYANAVLEGLVNEAKSSGVVNKSSTLRFSFRTLTLASGQEIPVTVDIQSYRNSKGQEGKDEEGNLVEKKGNVGKVAAGSAIGALIGGLAGGGKGAAIGAGVGAVASVLVVSVGVKGPSVRFAPGTEVDLTVSDRRK